MKKTMRVKRIMKQEMFTISNYKTTQNCIVARNKRIEELEKQGCNVTSFVAPVNGSFFINIK